MARKRRGGSRGRRHQRLEEAAASAEAAVALATQALELGDDRHAEELLARAPRSSESAAADGPLADLTQRLARARIERALAAGDGQGAREALARARANLSEEATRELALRCEAAGTDGVARVLAVLGDPARASERRLAEALLRERLSDPRAVANCDALPADHPLREQSRLAWRLFEAVTSRALTPEELAQLDQIPRRSPLAPWRWATEAIEHAYRGEQAAAAEALEKIGAGCVLGSLAPILLGAASPGAPRPATGPAAEVAAALRPAGDGLRDQLARLDAMLQEGTRLSRIGREGGKALAAAARRDPLVALEVGVALVRGTSDRREAPTPIIDALAAGLGELEGAKAMAIGLEPCDPVQACEIWTTFLRRAHAAGALRRRSLETALVLERMADLLDGVSLVATHGREHDLWARSPAALREEACAMAPRSAAFAKLAASYDAHGFRQKAEAKPVYTAWARYDPRAPEPILGLLGIAEAQGAYRQAFTLHEQLAALAPLHPGLREAEVRLLVRSTERRLGKAKSDLAAADLAKLDALVPTDDPVRVFVNALHALAAWREGAAVGADLVKRVKTGRGEGDGAGAGVSETLARVAIETTAARAGIALALPRAARADAREIGYALGDLFRGLARLRQPGGAPARRLQKALEKALSGRGRPPTWTEPERLLPLLEHEGAREEVLDPAAAYRLTTDGIRKDGPHLHRFLLARAKALAELNASTRAREVARVAQQLALERDDRRAAAAAGALAASLAEELFYDEESRPDREAGATTAVAERRRVIDAERKSGGKLPPPELSLRGLSRNCDCPACRAAALEGFVGPEDLMAALAAALGQGIGPEQELAPPKGRKRAGGGSRGRRAEARAEGKGKEQAREQARGQARGGQLDLPF